mgnify:CR=1 FL=1
MADAGRQRPPLDLGGQVVGAEGTPAERAGLVSLRKVVAVAGEPVTGIDSAWTRHLAAATGEEVKLFEQDGERTQVELPNYVWRIGIGLQTGAEAGDGLPVATPTDAAQPSPARDAGGASGLAQ